MVCERVREGGREGGRGSVVCVWKRGGGRIVCVCV